ncbi:MAG: Clp protease N-terminal domain-containing protein [Anaerolineales bacterium]
MSKASYPLTRTAQTAFHQAKRIAEQNKQPAIDSLALLLALLQMPKSTVGAVLKQLKVRVENLTARVVATIQLEAGSAIESVDGKRAELELSAEAESVFNEALAEMNDRIATEADELTLLLGMLRRPESKAGQILAQYQITAEQVRENMQRIKELPREESSSSALLKTLRRAMQNGISPIFISLVLFTATMAGFLWFDVGNNKQVVMFAFITSGWLVSLCLHEFGHAITAFWGGDESVEHKGYLTLNPLKYTHPLISIIIPLAMLLMGGVGFPGGAVYINIHALRKPKYRSLVSAAGPLANVLCLFFLALPFGDFPFYAFFSRAPFEFLAAVGMLALLQVVALFINLLPIPGIDGFGILEPFLPREWMGAANLVRPFAFLILFLLLWVDSPINDFFWHNIWSAMELIPNLAYYANEGVKIFFP